MAPKLSVLRLVRCGLWDEETEDDSKIWNSICDTIEASNQLEGTLVFVFSENFFNLLFFA